MIPHNEHYREKFAAAGFAPAQLRCLEDLARLPFTNKEDLLVNPRDFLLVPDQAALKRQAGVVLRALLLGRRRVQKQLEREFRPVLLTSTTGRSARPVPFFYTGHDIANLELSGRRMMEVCQSRQDFRHLNLFPFAPHLAFWLAHYAGTGFGTFCLSTGGGKVMGTAASIAIIDKIQPDALIGMPTFIHHVLTQALEEKRRWTQISRIVLGGEKVPPGLRRKLRALCAELGSPGVEVMATYGFTEAKTAWPECPSGSSEPTGYHLYPDMGIVEVVHPETGNPVDPGHSGEIVYTSLDSRGSVVLRYRTGDLIEGGLVHEPCPACGRTCPRLVGNIGRVSNVQHIRLDKIKGTLVDLNKLEHLLDDLDAVGAWQIEISKRNEDPMEPDQLVIHASLTAAASPEFARSSILRRFLEETEIRPNEIVFHSSEDMQERHGVGRNLKEIKILDRRMEAERPVPVVT